MTHWQKALPQRVQDLLSAQHASGEHELDDASSGALSRDIQAVQHAKFQLLVRPIHVNYTMHHPLLCVDPVPSSAGHRGA